MTKTPEELMEICREGHLEDGLYYLGNNKETDVAVWKNKEHCFYTMDNNIPRMPTGGAKILDPVPTYDEYKAMQDQIADASKKVEELRGLLKECKEFLENDGFDVYSWSKFAETEETLLTRIKTALNESEE